MRCGFRRREDFGGCEPRRGERHCERPTQGTVFGRHPATGAGAARNATNPCPAAGCNKPATSCAEKTVEVGRNHEDGTRPDGWHPSDRWGLRLPGVDARGTRRRKGTSDESHERRGRREPVPAAFERSEGEVKSTRASAAPASVGGAARPPGIPRRPGRRRPKAMEDAGKTPDPLPRAALGQLVSQPVPATLKDTSTPREPTEP